MEPRQDGKFPVALDVGCGTGHQSTRPLANYFNKVIAIDPSSSMIDVAVQGNVNPNIKYVWVVSDAVVLVCAKLYIYLRSLLLHLVMYNWQLLNVQLSLINLEREIDK